MEVIYQSLVVTNSSWGKVLWKLWWSLLSFFVIDHDWCNLIYRLTCENFTSRKHVLEIKYKIKIISTCLQRETSVFDPSVITGFGVFINVNVRTHSLLTFTNML